MLCNTIEKGFGGKLFMEISIYIAIGSVVISFISVGVALVTYKTAVRTQKKIFFNDLVKEERIIRLNLLGKSTDHKKELFFNYLEYLAYLIYTKQIDSKDAKTLLQKEIESSFDLLKKEDQEEYEYLSKVYYLWKTQR